MNNAKFYVVTTIKEFNQYPIDSFIKFPVELRDTAIDLAYELSQELGEVCGVWCNWDSDYPIMRTDE